MDAKKSKKIAAQKAKLEKERLILEELEKDARESEVKRFQRLADKVGFFDVEISDAEFEKSLKSMVEAAGSPQPPPA